MKFSDSIEPNVSPEIIALSKKIKAQGIPTVLPITLNELLLTLSIKQPLSILEIGTAVGLSGSAMLLTCKNAHLTTIEKDEDSFNQAKNTFESFGLSDNVKQFLGDAGDIIRFLDTQYDFIFLDGAKARYFDYLSDLKRLLKPNGVLFADNVLFRGYIDGGIKFNHRDNTIVRNMRAFLSDFINDKNYICTIHEKGDGILVAYKK
ncbi:MAG: O-methyltransferase [Clostridia bacterium]|nr:O-methyltransferase [Clostridia bacterium]MBR6687732.1 O-methyltransferase [Clostridia bacterium]